MMIKSSPRRLEGGLKILVHSFVVFVIPMDELSHTLYFFQLSNFKVLYHLFSRLSLSQTFLISLVWRLV